MRFNDDIPEITERELIERQRAKLAAIAAQTGGEIPELPIVTNHEGESMPRVRCIDTGEEFATVSEAERAKEIGTNSLGAAIRRSGQCKGLHWEFIDGNPPPDGEVEQNPANVSTKVRKMASLRRISSPAKRAAPAIAPVSEAITPAPAAATESSQGKLRVLFVECDGGAIGAVIDQVAQMLKGRT